MPLRSRAPRALGVLAAVALTLSGCAGQGATLPDAAPRTLTIGASVEPPTMDPTANDAAATAEVLLYNVYETLIKVDGEGHLQPLLARAWQVSPDRQTYTFTLDNAAKFASGRPVHAADVQASFQRLIDGKGTATLRKQMAVVDQIHTPDEHTVVVTLKQPSNQWLYNITQTAGIVLDTQADASLGTATAGSGPYQLQEWRQGQAVALQRNANYWGTAPRFDTVSFRYFTDATALNNALVSGDVDVIDNVRAPQALQQFSDASRFTVTEGTTNAEVVLGFNHANPPLDNLKVRQAINYAIDRNALLQTVWNGKGTLIGSMVPPTDPWYEDLSNAYPYDPDKARALLQEAGVTAPHLRLRVPTTPYATGAATFIKSQLGDVGISVDIDQLEFPSRWVDQVLVKGDYDMTIVAHVEPRDITKWADPHYYWHYDNPGFQALVDQADRGSDAEQVASLKAAATLLSSDAAADFLFLLPNLVVSKPEISGVPANQTGMSFDLSTVAAKR